MMRLSAIRILEALILSMQLVGVMGRVLMPKRVILITGTPRVGKTSVARMLASKLGGLLVNLTELAISENLIVGIDEKRDSTVVNLKKMKSRIRQIIEECDKSSVIIDGHYAAYVVPKRFASYVFVMRRDPTELIKLMEQSNFSGPKLWENLASEILDICLVDALTVYGEDKVCELDTSGKSTEEIVNDVLDILGGRKKCYVGIVDWIGKLEREGLLDEYLRI
jgi:adenylate kinase